MANLATKFLGKELSSPLVCSSCPLSAKLDNVRRMENAGAGAVVLHSLFEEQVPIKASDQKTRSGLAAKRLYSFPYMDQYNFGPDGYLDYIGQCKDAVGIPIIASLNGVTRGGWVEFARKIEQAGADALELNIYHIPGDPRQSAADIEQLYVDTVEAIRSQVQLPMAVKLGFFFTAPAHFAKRLDETGIQALVLFNRFYQPDINAKLLELQPSLRLSSSDELPLRLHWTALLFGPLKADIAITGGVHTGVDVAKAMLAGARAVEIASALFKHGIDHLSVMREELIQWLDQASYDSVEQMQGKMSMAFISDTATYERANYMQTIRDYSSE